jgi:L-Ala-D/L-Glu epimerase
MIEKARELDMDVMIGCMNESAIGTAAIAHLAPLADLVDMDGTLLLAGDIATGITFDKGRVIYPEGNGLSVKVDNF